MSKETKVSAPLTAGLALVPRSRMCKFQKVQSLEYNFRTLLAEIDVGPSRVDPTSYNGVFTRSRAGPFSAGPGSVNGSEPGVMLPSTVARFAPVQVGTVPAAPCTQRGTRAWRRRRPFWPPMGCPSLRSSAADDSTMVAWDDC